MRWIIVAMAALLAACNSHPEGARLDPALRLLVPSETTMLAAIQVEELVKSPLYKKHFAERPLPQLESFKETTGIDPRKDLWEVMLISDGTRSASVARGKFASLDSEPQINRPGGTRFRYKTYTLIGDEETAVLLLGPTSVGIGDTSLLRRVVDAHGESAGPRGVLEERMKQVPYEAEMWAVFSGSLASRLPFPKGKNTTVAAAAAESIQSGAMYLDADTLITADIALLSDGDVHAKQLHDSVKGLVGVGQLMAPQFQKLFQSVQVTQDAKTVRLHLQTDEGTLVPLFQLLP